MDISPIAQVALLHTEINSGFKFLPSTGIRSTENRQRQKKIKTKSRESAYFH
jgi:hypothetical protein